jgi:hypothetical protein
MMRDGDKARLYALSQVEKVVAFPRICWYCENKHPSFL